MIGKENITIKLAGGVSFDMIFVKGGAFFMGSLPDDPNIYADEKPRHEVKLSSFSIGKYLVTQELWRAIAKGGSKYKLEEDPSNFKGALHPVERVSWDDITNQFLPALNELTETTRPSNSIFRLPTEAEWEYAARGGVYHDQDYIYAGSDMLKEVGWYRENSEKKTHEVGRRYSNQLGIFDMSGNVYEWCSDWFDEEYYDKCFKNKKGFVEDPSGPGTGDRRVLRGGYCFSGAQFCRVASRIHYRPVVRYDGLGFRLVLQSSW